LEWSTSMDASSGAMPWSQPDTLETLPIPSTTLWDAVLNTSQPSLEPTTQQPAHQSHSLEDLTADQPLLKNVSPIACSTLPLAQKPGKFKEMHLTQPSVVLDVEVMLELEDSPPPEKNSLHTTPLETPSNAELTTLWLLTSSDTHIVPMLPHSEDYNAELPQLPSPTSVPTPT